MVEPELYQNEEILKKLLDNISSGVAIYETIDNGEHFIIREMNRAGLAICQVSQKDVIDKRLNDVFPSVDEFGFLDALRRVWKTGKSEHSPTSLYQDDRVYGWTEIYIYRLPSEKVVAIFDSQTKTIEAEKKLKQLNERLRNIFDKKTNEIQKIEYEKSVILESISEHIVFQKLDNTILWLNKAAADSAHSTPEELVGRKCYNVWNFIDEPCEGCPVLESLHTKKPVTKERLTPDGRYWIVSGYPIRDKTGKVNALVEVTREITKEKSAEQKLKESEEKYRKLFENSPIALMEQDYSEAKSYLDKLKSSGITDFDKYFDENPKEVLKLFTKNKVIDLNRKTIELYKAKSKEELIGKMNNFLNKEEVERNITDDVFLYNKRELLTFLKGETVYDSEIASKTFTKDLIYLHARTSILPGFEDTWSKVVISLVDITEKKNVEQQIKESEEKYRKAYYQANLYRDIFAHDINNILQNISSSVELSSLYIHNPEKLSTIRELYEIMDEQVNRAKKLISNVRKITEIDDSEINLEDLDVNQVIENAINFLQSSFQNRNLNIQVNSQNKRNYVLANNLLLDVFENILINAVRHNNNSQIDIDINISEEEKENNQYIKMEFRDNGLGISDYRKNSIFERGTRKSQKSKGMGLGLSLVKKIIDSYEGEIWVEDRIKGDYKKGSNFIILIPAKT
ncbi:MAG: ATP-binding protein [Promethearchaeota archaeon]